MISNRIKALFAVLLHVAALQVYSQDTIRIIAGAESHGLVRPCDCPEQPGGGVAQRAAVVRAHRERREVLFLDAGGFSGGGMYDTYSRGRQIDSVRTGAMIQAMSMVGYDAVGVGDDDIQFGGKWLKEQGDSVALPLVSANYKLRDGSSIAPAYRLVKKGSVTFAITSVGTPELLFDVDRNVVIQKPVDALKRVWPAMVESSDVQVILSHLGEEQSWELFDRFPEADIIVNGHRKVMTDPAAIRDGQRALMQFGFQGKQLSAVDMIIDSNGNVQMVNPQWLTIDESQADESIARHIQRVLADMPEEPDRTIPRYDLYIMSQCPYGLEAVKEILPVAQSFNIDMNLHFIGDVVGEDSLRSLRGVDEVYDEQVWLAVRELYPSYWVGFLHLRAQEGIETEEVIKILELDEKKIATWVKTYGYQALATHYRRSNRLQINASPTLLVDGVPVSFEIHQQRLSKELCESGQDMNLCDSLPECFDDSHCEEGGRIGVCEKEQGFGKCVYKEPVTFSFVAVVDDTALDGYEKQTIETTGKMFPGADVRVYEYDSKKGRSLYEKHNGSGLPFFLFGGEVESAHNFEKIVSGVEKSGNRFRFKPGVMRATSYPQRRKRASSLELFVDPNFSHLDEVMDVVYKFDSTLSQLKISPAYYGSPDDLRINHDSLSVVDVWLGMQMFDQNLYNRLLSTYLPENASEDGYRLKDWVNEKLLQKMHEHPEELHDRLEDIASLDLRKPVELLVDNQRIIPIMNPRHLAEELQRLQALKKGDLSKKNKR